MFYMLVRLFYFRLKIKEVWTYSVSMYLYMYFYGSDILNVNLHFVDVLLEGILNRMPQLNEAQIRQLTNGPESFTPDQNWILGESSEVRFFVAKFYLFSYLTPWFCEQSIFYLN